MASSPSWAKAPVEQVYRELGPAGTGGPGQNTQRTPARPISAPFAVIAKVLEKLDAQPSPSPLAEIPAGVFRWEKFANCPAQIAQIWPESCQDL